MANKPNHYFVHPLLRARDWQHRPQFDEVCDWWRGGGQGVCALIGIGGAGKTAIADRFLQVLPDVLPLDTSTPKDQSLTTPNSVFVFSFYDAPNPEAFFDALANWLHATVPTLTIGHVSPSGRISYHQLILWLQNAPFALLILDGLEKIQEDGTRGDIFGRIADGNLRDFIARLSQGWLPRLCALITSRFALADLDEASPTLYRPIDVEQIDLLTGIDLLRRLGVKGNDTQLAAIVENCGRHALTVDMAGGLMCEFHDGDPATNLEIGTPEEIEHAVANEQDPKRRAVLKQELRFAKVADRYRDALKERDPAALALLERICLFRLGVDAATLGAIFTGKAVESISGIALSELSIDQLEAKLDLLARMRLLEGAGAWSGPQSSSNKVFSIHPAIRDGFLLSLDAGTRREGHEAARHGLTAKLGARPGAMPSNPATLDLLEEIIHHTLRAGYVRDAWSIYQARLGGCHNLIAELNDYTRASRITNSILSEQVPTGPITQRDVVVLYSDFGYSNLELGRLSAARTALSKGLSLCETTNDGNRKTLAGNLACALQAIGLLEPARDVLCDLLSHLKDTGTFLNTACWIAEIDTQLGIPAVTILEADIPKNLRPGEKRELPITIRAAYLDNHRDIAESESRVLELQNRFPSGHASLADAAVEYAKLLIDADDLNGAADAVTEALTWAVAHDAPGVICECALLQARIALAKITEFGEPPNRTTEFVANGDLASGTLYQCAVAAIDRGLKIARDCGYGIEHIELLLARARLFLLDGNAAQALDDIRIALDDGRPANEKTGQPVLLAARDADCGYAWAVPKGLQFRAEALLLQAAQSLGTSHLTCMECGEQRSSMPIGDNMMLCENCRRGVGKFKEVYFLLNTPEFEVSEKYAQFRHWFTQRYGDRLRIDQFTKFTDAVNAEFGFSREDLLRLPLEDATVLLRDWQLTDEAKSYRGIYKRLHQHTSKYVQADLWVKAAFEHLASAMEFWRDLRDPDPTEDNNFVHPKTGKEYNYRAAETHRIWSELMGGILTRVPVRSAIPDGLTDSPAFSGMTVTVKSQESLKMTTSHRYDVLISYR